MSEMEHRAGSLSAAEQHEIGELIVRGLPGALAETISVLLETARVWMARREETVYRQGEPVPLTLIVHGYGAFRRTTEDGHDLMVGVGEPGDLFGFSSMAPVQSSVELVALTDCLVAQWPGAEIRKLAVDDPGLALRAAESMAESLHAVIERVEGFLHQDARRRVVRILARHRDLFFGESAVLTRAHLPSLVGTSREMTGRVLRQLEREGTITRVGRAGLRLLRPDRLGADAA